TSLDEYKTHLDGIKQAGEVPYPVPPFSVNSDATVQEFESGEEISFANLSLFVLQVKED
nr:hypothetical protein [Tanacetum cinerariifolium]